MAMAGTATLDEALAAATQATPPPQAQSRAGELGPATIDGFYADGHFRAKADPWFVTMHEHLLDVLENGTSATAPRPGTLTFGQHEMLARFVCEGRPTVNTGLWLFRVTG